MMPQSPIVVSKRRRQIHPAPSGPATIMSLPSRSSLASSSSSSSSSIIPLPSSHIRRTPSELQIADDTKRAEYDDVRMYARLVVGMQSQMQRGFQTNGGVVHPLSKKSLRGVVRTKEANLDDEFIMAKYFQDDDDGWEMSHAAIEDYEENECSLDSLGWSRQTRLPSSSTGFDSHGSLSTRVSMKNQEEDREECHQCVFCLEM